ncbi:MAG: ATP-binding protein [Spirulinaceae cyanobacterium]
MKRYKLGDYFSKLSKKTSDRHLQHLGILLLLVGAGYAGNYFKLTLFFGVDFLFGSIAVLLIISLYGLLPGVIAAVITSFYTLALWGHPYAILIFTAEAFTIGWFSRQKFRNLVFLDSIYWLAIGIPLVLIFYGQVMAMPWQSAIVIALKQAVNGIFNALIVSLLLAHTPLSQLAPRRYLKRGISLQQTLFNWLIAFVFIPTLLLIVVNSRALLGQIQTDVQRILEVTSENIVIELQTWQQQRSHALIALGNLSLSVRNEGNTFLQEIFLDGQQVIFVDATGQAIAPTPENLPNLNNIPLGLSAKSGAIFQRQPINSGEIIAQFEPRLLENRLRKSNNSRLDLSITLRDRQNNAIATSGESLNLDRPNTINTLPNGIYHWLPDKDLPLMARWKQSYYIRDTDLGSNPPWILQIATPVLPHILKLEAAYIHSLLIVLSVTIAALPCAFWLSRRLLNPLYRLTQLTYNLPDKLVDRTEIPWFETGVTEINALLKNFQAMAIALQDKFQEIKTANETLENRVTERTQALQASEAQLREKAQQLQTALTNLRQTQTQLVQTEKMSSLGQLVAGIAHEINNPVNFVFGNLTHAKDYIRDLLELIELYQDQYPHPTPEIADEIEAIDLEFVRQDLPKMLNSMTVGAERIRDIIISLRNFSRLDEASIKAVNIHEGIETTLMILHNRLKSKPDYPGIHIVKEYSQLPDIECYPGELNQVFMNLIANAIDALEEAWEKHDAQSQAFRPLLRLQTHCIDSQWVTIHIIDNGLGISADKQPRLFDPFFTTKPIGKGTGLGLSISYQIVVERHQGHLSCHSQPGEGTEFVIKIPCRISA